MIYWYMLIAVCAGAVGFAAGACASCDHAPPSDIDLDQENKKLRKENEVLWARLKDEGKIDKF